jgi:hypothetical protein
MTPRERILALGAVALIVVFGGGVLGYQFVLRPLQQKEKAAQTLREEIEKGDTTLMEFTKNRPRLELAKKESLPADVELARSKYVEELIRLLRTSDFPDSGQESSAVNSKPPEKIASGPGAKKPPFQRLQFDVQCHGEETSLIEFLDRFYRTPLLHRIRTLTINKASTARAGVLDVTMLIEALIVDGAEKRETLLPAGVEPLPRLARAKDVYATIAGRNIFFGPPPSVIPTIAGSRETAVEATEWIRLDGITLDTSTGDDASLYDVYNDRWYMIHRSKGGFVTVKKYLSGKVRKIMEEVGEELAFKDEDGEVTKSYKIVRIDATELFLESEGIYYRMHIGWSMKEVRPITSEAELKQYRLPVKVKKVVEPKEESKDDKKPTKVAEK